MTSPILRNPESPFILWIQIDIYFLARTIYLSGGIYTASPARLAGRLEVLAVTPHCCPIRGCGEIVFTETTSVLESAPRSGQAENFLEYLLEPERAYRVALAERTANPVAQTAMPEVFQRFTARDLEAIQWGTLEEEVAAAPTTN